MSSLPATIVERDALGALVGDTRLRGIRNVKEIGSMAMVRFSLAGGSHKPQAKQVGVYAEINVALQW